MSIPPSSKQVILSALSSPVYVARGAMVHDEKKRKWRDDGAKRRKHDRNKFRRITNTNSQKKDLTAGLSGILVSCSPRHERDAFRDAVLLFSRFLDETNFDPAPGAAAAAPTPSEGNSVPEAAPKPTLSNGNDGAEHVDVKESESSLRSEQNRESELSLQPSHPPAGRSDEASALDEVDAELRELRNPQTRIFSKIDCASNGAVFMRVHAPQVDLEHLVEAALREARATGSSGGRHCFRITPVHTTCYAKPEDVIEAMIPVVQKFFPAAIPDDDVEVNAVDKLGNDKKPTTYAIAFRSRSNTGAHRDDYIPGIASAIEKMEPRYKVNLTAPDVTLIVEIVKTTCFIGTFRHYFQLAKLNLQEAACPSKRNTSKQVAAPPKGDDDNKLDGAASNEAKPVELKSTEEEVKLEETSIVDMSSGKCVEGEKSSKEQENDSVAADAQVQTT